MHTAARTVLTATLWAAYAVTNYFQLYPALGKQVGESATVYTNMPSAGSYAGLWDSTGGLCDGSARWMIWH